MLSLTNNTFNQDGYWVKTIPDFEFSKHSIRGEFPIAAYVDIFDQNGYDLTYLEQMYASANYTVAEPHRYKKTLKQNWFTQTPRTEKAVLNHAYLFERKGYQGPAAEQLKKWAVSNPLVYKLLAYRPKWGVDFSMDWVDRQGNVFEVLHFEYDSFSYKEIQSVKTQIETKLLTVDWDKAGEELLKRKDEWSHLGFFEQSDWKCNYFNIIPERFKMVAWT